MAKSVQDIMNMIRDNDIKMVDLNEKNVDVTVVEMKQYLMNNIVHANRSMLLWLMSGMGSPTDKISDKLDEKIKVYTSTKLLAFKENQAFLHFFEVRFSRKNDGKWTRCCEVPYD